MVVPQIEGPNAYKSPFSNKGHNISQTLYLAVIRSVHSFSWHTLDFEISRAGAFLHVSGLEVLCKLQFSSEQETCLKYLPNHSMSKSEFLNSVGTYLSLFGCVKMRLTPSLLNETSA